MATQSEVKYNRLMEKAEELFISLGYKAVSVEEIAEAAGISKMTLYRHFSSKEDLFIAVVLSVMNKTYVLLEEEIDNRHGILEKIDYLMKFNMTASKDYSIAFYKDIMSIPYITKKLMERKYEISTKMFEKMIQEGIEKGEIRQVNIPFITDMLIMMIDGFAEKFFNKINSQQDIEEVVKDFYDFLKYGLLGGKGVN